MNQEHGIKVLCSRSDTNKNHRAPHKNRHKPKTMQTLEIISSQASNEEMAAQDSWRNRPLTGRGDVSATDTVISTEYARTYAQLLETTRRETSVQRARDNSNVPGSACACKAPGMRTQLAFAVSVDESNADRARYWRTVLTSHSPATAHFQQLCAKPADLVTEKAFSSRETRGTTAGVERAVNTAYEEPRRQSGERYSSQSICNICNTLFKRKYDLMQHIQAVRKFITCSAGFPVLSLFLCLTMLTF
jgi:hypothetical protein